jgi:hypothetical protein
VLAASTARATALTIEAASTFFETSINFYQTTWCNITEETHLRFAVFAAVLSKPTPHSLNQEL